MLSTLFDQISALSSQDATDRPRSARRPLWLSTVFQLIATVLGAFCALATVGISVPTSALEAPDLDDGETMVIRADEAWETRATQPDGSKGPRALHFKGNFRLDAPDWFVRAETATLFGAVDNPERIKVTGGADGKPARVWMIDENGAKEVDATAREIEYFRHNDRLKLQGDALLEEQRNTLRSSSIDYDLNERRLVATGKGGVEIITMPNRDPTPGEAATP